MRWRRPSSRSNRSGRKANGRDDEAAHRMSQREIEKSGASAIKGRLQCVIPKGGIEHNNVSRMLLTAGDDNHLSTVPMAFFMDRQDTSVYRRSDYVTSLI